MHHVSPPELPSSHAVAKSTVDADLLVAGAANLALKLAGVGIMFLLTVCLARLLGPAQFGTYTVAMYAVTLAATLAGAGLPPLITREIAASRTRQDWLRIGCLLSQARRRTLLVATMVSVAAAGVIVTRGGGVLLVGFLGIVAVVCLVPVVALNTLRSAALRGLGRSVLADIPELLVQPAMVLLFVVAAYWLSFTPTTASVLVWQLAAAVAAMGFGYALLRSQSAVDPSTAAIDADSRTWMRGAWASAAFSVLSLLEIQISVYVLSGLRGPEPVAHFQAARQVVAMVSVGLTTLNLPLQSRLAAAWAVGNREETQRLTLSAARMGFWFALCAAVVLVPLAKPVLALFGEEYQSGASALRLLALGQLVNAAAGPCGVVLLMTGHHRQALVGVLAAIAVTAAVAFSAIPALDATGAGLAAVAGVLTWNVILALLAWKHARLYTPALPIARARARGRTP